MTERINVHLYANDCSVYHKKNMRSFFTSRYIWKMYLYLEVSIHIWTVNWNTISLSFSALIICSLEMMITFSSHGSTTCLRIPEKVWNFTWIFGLNLSKANGKAEADEHILAKYPGQSSILMHPYIVSIERWIYFKT